MIERLFRSLTKFSAGLFIFGLIDFAVMLKVADFPYIFMPSHDYEYVLENGLKEKQHIKGEIFYSLGGFASAESYTQYEGYRTESNTTGYYYIIPVGNGGMAAVYVHKSELDDMEALTEETYNYLMGGEAPRTGVYFEGVTMKMEENLEGLEEAFRDELEYLGYTESEIEEMLVAYSDGECLLLEGPADMSVMYVMMGIAFAVLLLSVILIVRNYRRELEYDRMKEKERMRWAANVEVSDTFQTTYDADK